MNPNENEQPLSRVLGDWRVEPRRNPRFRAAVWARIGAEARPATWPGYFRAHAVVLTGALALALAAGAWVGREEARARVAADRATIASAYVQSLDARAMRMP
jgi:hypothetical protein